MKLLVGALALAITCAPALAQRQDDGGSTMPGMEMPMPAQPAPPPGQGAEMPGMTMPAQQQSAAPAQTPSARKATGDDMAGMSDHGGMTMTGALGTYPMTREASGTAWQPDSSEHGGIHMASGGWSLMVHALLNAVYDTQQGPRGADKGFVSGMVMGMARRELGPGTLQFRVMLSPEPLMGARGYPLLLASGETANGRTPLVDRQHPHDFFMELSASYSLRLNDHASVFVYGGLPGEPAFGPPAFMHRLSIMDSPEAPISHHWLDSTHISFGVVTAGLIVDNVKVEASRFNAREPDQHRWNIETGKLDSTAVRLSWNPSARLSLQASWGHFVSPEQLEPGVDQKRWSASAIYTLPLGEGWWSTTLAWGRRLVEHEDLDAFAVETALHQGPWTIFARGERTENNELGFMAGHHGPTYRVGKISVGFVRDFPVAKHVAVGAGGLVAFNFVPKPLEASYDGDPKGAMAFLRLKID